MTIVVDTLKADLPARDEEKAWKTYTQLTYQQGMRRRHGKHTHS